MKTTITITAVLIAILLVVSCTTVKPTTTEVIVLRDITQTSLANPNATEISRFFDLSSNPWNGATFHFENITDVSYNPVNEVKVTAKDEWLSNELARTKEIKVFNDRISEIITNSEKDTIGKNASSIYVPLVMKLNELSQSTSERRVLIIYSDLMENTKDISFYTKKTINLLQTNSDAITKQFEAMQAINNLQGIQVYFIFQPTDQNSDANFKTVSEFYKKLLEDKGAKVTITANLNF